MSGKRNGPPSSSGEIPKKKTMTTIERRGRLVQRGSALRDLASLARAAVACRVYGSAPSRDNCSPQIISAVFALAIHSKTVNRLMAPTVESSFARFSQSMPGSSCSCLAHTVYGSLASFLGVLSGRIALFPLQVGPGSFSSPLAHKSMPGSSTSSLTQSVNESPAFSPSRFLALSPAPCRASWKGHSFLSPSHFLALPPTPWRSGRVALFCLLCGRVVRFSLQIAAEFIKKTLIFFAGCVGRGDRNVDNVLGRRLSELLLPGFADFFVAQEPHDSFKASLASCQLNPCCSISATKLSKSRGRAVSLPCMSEPVCRFLPLIHGYTCS